MVVRTASVWTSRSAVATLSAADASAASKADSSAVGPRATLACCTSSLRRRRHHQITTNHHGGGGSLPFQSSLCGQPEAITLRTSPLPNLRGIVNNTASA